MDGIKVSKTKDQCQKTPYESHDSSNSEKAKSGQSSVTIGLVVTVCILAAIVLLQNFKINEFSERLTSTEAALQSKATPETPKAFKG